MDLGAYANITLLETIAKNNGIEVPRLRGYRLMVSEKPIDYTDLIERSESACCEDLCRSFPLWKPNADEYDYNSYTDWLVKYYCPNGKVRWDRIHGRKRKILKFEIKKEKRRVEKQYETFNKYVGRADILYIHSRIGGNNWPYYHEYVDTKPWFIEKVDDAIDSTYCDIYAKIKIECN